MAKEKKAGGAFSLVLAWAGANRKFLVASMVAATVSGLMTMVPYWGVYRIMQAAYAGTLTEGLLAQCAAVVAVGFVVQYACFAASSLLSHKGAYRTLFDVRCRIVDHLAHAPLGSLSERSIGQVKTVLLDDVERLELFLAHNIPEAFMYLAGPVAAFAFLCSTNAPLALATLVPFAAAVALMGACFKVMGEVMPRAAAALSRMNSVMVEYVSGMRVIKRSTWGRPPSNASETASTASSTCGARSPARPRPPMRRTWS